MDGRYVFYKTLIVAFTLLGLLLLWQLAEVIIVLLGAIIFASAIRPIVNWVAARGVPPGLAILVVYLLLLTGIGGLLAVAIPPLFGVISSLVQDEGLIMRLGVAVYQMAEQLGYQQIGADLGTRVISEWGNLQTRAQIMAAEEGPSVLQATAIGIGQLVLALVMAFYWLTSRDRMQGFMLSVTPVRHRARLETIFNDVEATMGDWLRGTGVLMLSIGVSAFIGLSILQVPYPLALAVIAGLFEAIPMVGATLGALPAVLVAFSISPITGVLTILLFVIIQFLENNILVPRVMERSVGLSPLLVIIAITAGGLLNGIIGALLAIPVVAALQVILRHLVVEPMVEEASQRTVEHGVPVFVIPEDELAAEAEAAGNGKNKDILIARS